MKFRASDIEKRLLEDAAEAEANMHPFVWWGNGPLESHFVAPPRSERFRDFNRKSKRWLWTVLDTAPEQRDAFLVVYDPRHQLGEYGIARKGRPIGTFYGFVGSFLAALYDLHEAQPSQLPPHALSFFDRA